ncbi:MAG: Gfo/Idh/MocA family oxidoreductase [Candidatus Marinimicrobia bacterium]|jgi:predicted dehydrogenase|nr:Gfo/Idh/MocA family oxidoreductase [Candidatus Neomarinimicrobiota bacterium]
MSLSLGFIGGGLNSAVGQAHYCASQLDKRWELCAGLFSQHGDINLETGKAWHVDEKRVYPDLGEFLVQEQQSLDAVVVLTPTPSHADIVCKLLDQGIAVICEKALTASIADLRRIESAYRENSFLAVTYNYSGYPMVRELQQRIKAGELGKIHQIQIEMPADVYLQIKQGEYLTPQSWRLEDGEIPTILLDLGVHLHHLCQFLTGLNPLEVNADYHNYSRFDDVVDDAHLWVKYEQGMNASMWMSKTALGHRNGLRVRIYGEKGSAEWYQMDPENLTLSDQQGRKTVVDRGCAASDLMPYERFKPGHPIGFVEAFANLYGDIADALIDHRQGKVGNHPYVYGLEHAAQGLHMLRSATLAHEQRRWILL